jgi:hypothetical protein
VAYRHHGRYGVRCRPKPGLLQWVAVGLLSLRFLPSTCLPLDELHHGVSISRAWASAKTFLRSTWSFLAPEAVSLNTPTMWWPTRRRTSGDRVPSTVNAVCASAGPTNGESRTAGARHRDRNAEDDRNGGADYSSLRRPQWQMLRPLPVGP